MSTMDNFELKLYIFWERENSRLSISIYLFLTFYLYVCEAFEIDFLTFDLL